MGHFGESPVHLSSAMSKEDADVGSLAIQFFERFFIEFMQLRNTFELLTNEGNRFNQITIEDQVGYKEVSTDIGCHQPNLVRKRRINLRNRARNLCVQIGHLAVDQDTKSIVVLPFCTPKIFPAFFSRLESVSLKTTGGIQ